MFVIENKRSEPQMSKVIFFKPRANNMSSCITICEFMIITQKLNYS